MPEHMGMHGMGMMHHPVEPLVEKMWERLSEDQIRQIIIRRIESGIMQKEAWVKQLQFKIETYKMVRQMIEKGK